MQADLATLNDKPDALMQVVSGRGRRLGAPAPAHTMWRTYDCEV